MFSDAHPLTADPADPAAAGLAKTPAVDPADPPAGNCTDSPAVDPADLPQPPNPLQPNQLDSLLALLLALLLTAPATDPADPPWCPSHRPHPLALTPSTPLPVADPAEAPLLPTLLLTPWFFPLDDVTTD